MQIVDNKALLLVTKKADIITSLIPRSQILARHGEKAQVLVHWGYEETKILRNLKIKNVPCPIHREYKWPGFYKPMAHQREMAAFMAANTRCYNLSTMGVGKTSAAAWAADYLMSKGIIKRVLVLCPLSIMETAWQSDLFKTVMHRTVGIAHGSREVRKRVLDANYEFVIMNHDGVKVMHKELQKANFDLIIVDECFPAGTKVLTPQGERAIETLKTGDEVVTSNGSHRIRTVVQRRTRTLVTLEISNGKRIRVTPEHPIFTDLGWLPAKDCANRQIFTHAALRDMQHLVPEESVIAEVGGGAQHADRSDLLTILRTEEVPPVEPRSVLFQHHAEQLSERPSGPSLVRGEKEESGDRAGETPQVETPSAGGQWQGYGALRSHGSASYTERIYLELRHRVGWEAAWLSHKLQSRFWQPEHESSVGGRWGVSQQPDSQGTRPEERSQAPRVRVDRVSVEEFGCDQVVFNLDVAGTPNYFAEGVLVHNCSVFKNAQSDRSKALASIIRPTTWVWGMTGSPAAQCPTDAYGLAKIVRPDSVPMFFKRFRDLVLRQVTTYKWVPKPNAKEVVFNTLQPAIRFTKEECLDLPALTYTTREVPLTKMQETFYNRIKTQMKIQAAGLAVTAANAAVLMNKLLQISAGAVWAEEGEFVEFDISNRYAELLDLIQQTEHKVIVFVPFTNTINLLEDMLTKDGISNGVINGEVPLSKRTERFKAFQTEDDPKVLIIQPQSAAHGVTLTAADTVVWWGPVASTETYLQANARAHRHGQKNKVTVIHLQGSSVERRVFKMLQSNIEMHNSIVDLYKEELGLT